MKWSSAGSGEVMVSNSAAAKPFSASLLAIDSIGLELVMIIQLLLSTIMPSILVRHRLRLRRRSSVSADPPRLSEPRRNLGRRGGKGMRLEDEHVCPTEFTAVMN